MHSRSRFSGELPEFQFETKMGDTDGTKPFFVKASLKSFTVVVKEAELSRVRLYQRGGGVAYTDSDAATDADMRDSIVGQKFQIHFM